MTMTPVARERLNVDALNRGFRTVLQALAVEVGFYVTPVVWRLLMNEATVWDLDVARSLIRIAAMAVVSFVMRRYLDLSPIPTPLPPQDPGRPAVDQNGDR